MVVLIVAGLQVPVIEGLSLEPDGRAGAGLNWHSGPMAAKAGVSNVMGTDAVAVHPNELVVTTS